MNHIMMAMDVSPVSDRAFERAWQLAQAHDAELTVMHVIDEQILNYDDDYGMEERLIANVEAKLKRHWARFPKAKAERIHLVVKVGSPWEDIIARAKKNNVDLMVLGLHRVNPLKDVFIGTTAERIIRHSHVPVLVVKDKPVGSYRKVLVSTDFSPCSSHALEAALDLVPKADFQLLHVFETPFPHYIHFSSKELADYKQERSKKAAKQIEHDMKVFLRCHLAGAKPSITPLLERNDVVGGIVSTLQKEQPDLLVMGTHGGVRGALLGSTALTFLNDPPCDVLVTR